MTPVSPVLRLDTASLRPVADWLALGVALALPWSTSLTSVFIVAWLVAVLPTLDAAAIKRELATAAGGLPVLLWCLGLVGMAWADVGWIDRCRGLDGFNRLLVIPLLLAQFRRSDNGIWVACGYLVSETAVLLLSYILILTPGLMWRGHLEGVPVHDDIYQGSAFLVCAFGALGYAACRGRANPRVALGFLIIAALFIANFALVVVSRIALIVAPVLIVLFGWRLKRLKGVVAACGVAFALGGMLWTLSPSLRLRLHDTVGEIQRYRASEAMTSIGLHAAFFKESVEIISTAPVLGHGTGTIAEQFRQVTQGGRGADAVVADNPHNQTFTVAIQVGIVGAVVLWAMWIAHLLLFRGDGLASWLGPVVVVENIVSSTAHSHLFDFANGWLYVFGVGVLGGMALRERSGPSAKPE
ncbi:MAG TPA: O-antigen ligase family protein [Xanthobacteraceae bacterium]|nr:O-antigen ligase family protein [Xanthobacteraceae bacterium]